MINRKRVIICLIVFLMVFQAQTASALTRQDAPDYFSRDLETNSRPMAHGRNPLALEGLSDEEWQGIKNQVESNLHITYLKASNTDRGDWFGGSVAISGNTIVVGAYQEDSNGVNGNQQNNNAEDAGAAYVFTRDGQGNWSQQAYLKASNTDRGDWFGCSVAISGDAIVVGASEKANRAGAAYVFTRDGQGNWSQQAYLKASNADVYDQFGDSVAISGDTIVVGAYQEASSATGVNGNQQNNSASEAGAAYVFTRDSQGNWSQQAHLKASNTDAHDYFGESVAISGDTIVVGASAEASNATGVNGEQHDNSKYWAGAAYVFTRDDQGNWSQQAYLKASNTDERDKFGDSVTISGDTIVVGAWGESSSATGVNNGQDNNNATWAGAAYVYDSFEGNPNLYLPIIFR